MELISLLTSQLGVSEGQAKGGLGSILNFAKEQLSDGDFSSVSGLIEGASGLMNDAPAAEGMGGMLGKVTSALGAGTGIGGLAALASQFKSLDLDGDMMKKFAPIVTGFLESKGGSGVSAILGKLLG